jgi:putative membrane-bound dehydrogenase-like protein
MLVLSAVSSAVAADGNRLAYLQECNPYYPSRTFPKLTTPQWVGEEGVEAVVILAIDDMKGHELWEKFLRPILNRLKKIDGRAPVSIMTCQIDPKDPHLQTWLKEGVSLETHTFDHPCPFFSKGFARAKETYEKCVDLLHEVPGNKPVAFRMPCCDSMNTPSPRFYAEIFNKTTPKGHFLQIDSSVFNVFTPRDKELPRSLVLDEQGRERFTKYLPADRAFVNTIEDYPYPYVIDRLCWEFPCVTPSDWQAQHLHKPANPITVKDWKAALDCTVIKQGVFTMVFHPYGWSTPEQHVELIDYAVAKYGKKVKFLTFREALERLNKNLLGGQPLRGAGLGGDNEVRVLDVDNDGYMDVVIGNRDEVQTRLWSQRSQSWRVVTGRKGLNLSPFFGRFGVLRPDGRASFVAALRGFAWVAHFNGTNWVLDAELTRTIEVAAGRKANEITGVQVCDLDRDGCCELILGGEQGASTILSWSPEKKAWQKAAFSLPAGASIPAPILLALETGTRFADLDGDGKLDVIWSNEESYGLYLFKDMQTGWTKVLAGKAGDKDALPLIANKGSDMGAWFHSKHIWWSNENTVLFKDHVARRSFEELLRDVQPGPRSPQESLKVLQPRPGFVAELVAAEPLVKSPIAFAWGPDGKLWVVEMGDYPLGVDGKGKPGGRVKFLESTKGDGKYDKMTVFMEGLPFPTGVLPWRKGVLVTCAPDIFYAEDTNGDGKADKKVVLFTGFVEGNQQHRVNTLAWGLDGWIYCANGDSGGTIKSVKTGQTVNISGRDLRIKPDTSELEAVTGQTQYGRSRDDWGNWFGGNNSDPVRHYVLDDHYLRRNPHFAAPTPRVQISVEPGTARVYPISRTLPRFNDFFAANRFTSACSPIIYRDDLFDQPGANAPGSPRFAGNVFISEPVHNLVHREIMKGRGVTFQSRRAPDEERSEFLASADNWFRPTTIQTGPDGALWVADMYRHVIEHPQWIPIEWQKKLDLRAGADKGRIYRIYPEGKKPRAIPRLDKLDTKELVFTGLQSPNGWQRDLAHMMLVWKADPAAIPWLDTLAGTAAARPEARLHALCALSQLWPRDRDRRQYDWLLGGWGGHKCGLADAHPGVRKQAVRLCEERLPHSPGLGEGLVKLVADPDPQVRMQLAYTLGAWDNPAAGKALGQLAVKDAGDPYITAAVMSSVSAGNLDHVLLGALETAAPPPAVIENLLRLANAFGKSRAMVTLLGRVTTPEKGGFAPWQYSALAGLLDTLDQRGSSLTKLAQEGDKETREVLKKVDKLIAAARLQAADVKTAPAQRALAVRLLGRNPALRDDDLKLLGGLLVPQTAAEVQTAAVVTIGRLRPAETPRLLTQRWDRLGPAVRSHVLDVLLSREEWARTVLDLIEKKNIRPFEVDAARRQRLLDHKNAELRSRAAKVFVGGVPSPDRQKVIDAYRDVLTLKGDPARGGALFAKHCAICHRLVGEGNDVGPDLSGLTDKSSQALLIAVLDPNRAVEARYVNYLAVTKNGLSLNGVLASETGTSITLVGPDGKAQVVLRTDLEELVSTGKSAMPEGLEKDLRPQDLADLFAYLRAPVPPKRQSRLERPQPSAEARSEPPGQARRLARALSTDLLFSLR